VICFDKLGIDAGNSMPLHASRPRARLHGAKPHLSEAPFAALEKGNLGALLMDKDIDAFLKIVVFSLSTPIT
jgi:hypothetical protein